MTIPEKLIQELVVAKRVTVFTGAGVSAESGVPTFRDAQTGLWSKYRPEELATPRAFRRNPRLVWEWYEWRRKLVADAKPNPAHLALAEMEKLFPRFQLITQNVDGLHQRAGSKHVIELHGNITRTKCFDEGTIVSNWKDTGEVPPKCPNCGGLLRPDVVWFEEPMPEAEMEKLFPKFHLITQNVDGLHQLAGSRCVIELHGNIMRTKCFDEGAVISSWKETGDIPPKCPNCGGLLRPGVVWFEEPLPEAEMELAARASTTCDVFLTIGTSTIVYPAAELPNEALRSGATVVEINPQSTPFTDKAHYVLAGAAGVVLPDILARVKAS